MQSNDISIKVFSTLPKALESQSKALSLACFSWAGHQTAKQKEEGKDRFCSNPDTWRYVIAIEDNNLVGQVVVLKRNIPFDGKSIILGGIGGMCTSEDKRKHGIGAKLLAVAMKELREAGCDVCYLCTDIKKPWMVSFYRKEGFVVLGRPHTYLGKSGKRYTDHDAMIAPVNSRVKFDHIMESKLPLDIGIGNW